MDELFPEEGNKCTLISDRFRQIIKEHGNVEPFELLELANKVHCKHCHKYMTSGQVSSHCGRETRVRLSHDTCLPADERTKNRKNSRRCLCRGAVMVPKNAVKEGRGSYQAPTLS